MRHVSKFMGLTCLLAAGLGMFSTAAYADSIRSDYGLYLGGVKLGAATIRMDGINEGDGAFQMVGKATTTGMLKSFYDWNATSTSRGTLDDSGYKLDFHSWVTDDRGKEKYLKLYWDQNGVMTADYNPPLSAKYTRHTVTQEQKNNTVDPLFALATAGLLVDDPKNMCRGVIPVFDGKRRFNFNLRPANKEVVTLPKSRYSAYSGDAVECIVDFQPIAGRFKHENEQEALRQGKAISDIGRLWFGYQESQKNYVLVRGRARTPFGVAFVHIKTR